jgi:2-keto-4-pentenoate hydratase/2-oxohepta-3-ene-1,7-dioic acid hydratase in catechol pathway
MKLASYRSGGVERFGLSPDGARLFDLGAAFRKISAVDGAPRSMLDLIESGDAGLAKLRAAASQIAKNPSGFESAAVDSVEVLAPVTRPSKICCLALNNSANADRIMSGPKHPAMFHKPASALVGHRGDIEVRPEYGRVHPEPELAVVVGRTAKNIKPETAYDHVFGYTIHNDITSPTMRGEDTFHYRAIHPKGSDSNEIEYIDTWVSYPGRYKGADTFACMGPWIVTKDEIENPHDLTVTCEHQGRLVTEDNTENLFFKIPQVFAFLSSYTTLWPGDIVSMGTALKKSAKGGAVQNVDLAKLGGPISVSIEKIGTLVNGVKKVG